MEHDPIEDEHKGYSLDEWITLAKSELDKYADVFRNQNDFHKQKHTWDEWFRSFLQYMSW